MNNYIIIILLNKIIQILLVIVFVFLTYRPTKEIVKRQLEIEIDNFHSDYLVNNYHLKLVNMNNIDSIDKAITYIQSFPEYFDIIPEEEVLSAKMFLSFSRKYNYYQNRILYFIGLSMTIELAIMTGLGI